MSDSPYSQVLDSAQTDSDPQGLRSTQLSDQILTPSPQNVGEGFTPSVQDLELSQAPDQVPASFPKNLDLTQVSDESLAGLIDTAPVLYNIGSTKLVRISESLVLKGGHSMSEGQAKTQMFAAAAGLSVPTVHRVFSRPYSNRLRSKKKTTWFMVMDYVPGRNLDEIWPELDGEARKAIVEQAASMITMMQSRHLSEMPPGPIGETETAPWKGPWFTEYGAGPFSSVTHMEDWYNHKRDVCLRLGQARPDLPRFEFGQLVLTHQDIAPRNFIYDKDSNRLWLIDWGMAGNYPLGFEQATLFIQSAGDWDDEFCMAVLEALPDRCSKQISQLKGITYGLTTGAFM